MSDDYEHGQSEDHGYEPPPAWTPRGKLVQGPTPPSVSGPGFSEGNIKGELEASQEILDGLVGEVKATKKAADEGDSLAISERAKTILGRHPAEYAANVLDVAGVAAPGIGAYLDPRSPMGRSPGVQDRVRTIVDWAERMLVWFEIGTPPRRAMFPFDVKIWGSGPGRNPAESYPVPEVPACHPRQRYAVQWLTWLGFEIDANDTKEHQVESPVPLLGIVTTPEQLTSEAKRLATVLRLHGIDGKVHAEYRPAVGGREWCVITTVLDDSDFGVDPR